MHKIRFNIAYALITIIGLLYISCEEPLSPRYNNSSDPTSPTYVPTGPGGLSALVVNDSLVTLKWGDQSLGEDGFKLFMKSGNDSTFALIANLQKNLTSYEDTLSKLQNVIYKYRLYSFKGNKLSKTYIETTAQFSFKTPVITSVSGTDSTKLTLRWQNNNSFSTEMVVERKDTSVSKSYSNSAFSVVAVIPPGENEFTDLSVDKYHAYLYRITPKANHNVPSSSNVMRCGYQITGDLLIKSIRPLHSSINNQCGILSNDGQLFLSIGIFSGDIVDFTTGNTICSIDFHTTKNKDGGYSVPRKVAISKNKKVFAFLKDTIAYVYDISQGTLIHKIIGFNYGTDLALTDNGSQVITGSTNGEVKCWNISDGTLAWENTFSPSNTSLWLYPDGQRLLIGNKSNCYWIDIQTGAILYTSQGGYFFRTPVICNGEVLVITSDLKCYNLTKNMNEFSIASYGTLLSESAYSTWISVDKLFVIAGDNGEYLKIINLVTGNSFYPQDDPGWNYYLRFLNNDQQLLIYGQGDINIYQLQYNWSGY